MSTKKRGGSQVEHCVLYMHRGPVLPTVPIVLIGDGNGQLAGAPTRAGYHSAGSNENENFGLPSGVRIPGWKWTGGRGEKQAKRPDFPTDVARVRPGSRSSKQGSELDTALVASKARVFPRSADAGYSASVSPEPPNCLGKSLNFGRPSCTVSTFSP